MGVWTPEYFNYMGDGGEGFIDLYCRLRDSENELSNVMGVVVGGCREWLGNNPSFTEFSLFYQVVWDLLRATRYEGVFEGVMKELGFETQIRKSRLQRCTDIGREGR